MTLLQQVMVRGSLLHSISAHRFSHRNPFLFQFAYYEDRLDNQIRFLVWSSFFNDTSCYSTPLKNQDNKHFAQGSYLTLLRFDEKFINSNFVRLVFDIKDNLNSCLLWCAQNRARMFQMTLGILSYNIVNVSLEIQFVK